MKVLSAAILLSSLRVPVYMHEVVSLPVPKKGGNYCSDHFFSTVKILGIANCQKVTKVIMGKNDGKTYGGP